MTPRTIDRTKQQNRPHFAQRRWARGVALTTLLALACSSGGGPALTEGASIGVQQDALAASTTVAQALGGRVNPVPGLGSGGLIAAASTGSVDVNHDGSAAYSLPIWTPDGVRNLEPSLSIAYNSEWGKGLLGPHWNITGLSKITRCKQTLAQNAVERPVSFAGDTFCLDEHQLVRTSGTATGVGNFVTEINPFQKIVATGADSKGITAFQVYDNDGRIYSYGKTFDLSGAGGSIHYAYYLSKIQDRYGNSILISYRRDNNFSCCTIDQELVPDVIRWGGTGDTAGLRSAKFYYQPSSSYNPSKYQQAVNGQLVVGGQFLSRIELSGPSGAGTIVLLKKYAFTYTTPSVSGERLLQSISECDANGVCKRPTNVTWEPGSNTYSRVFAQDSVLGGAADVRDTELDAAPFVANGSVGLANVYRRILAVDLNNDGRDDLVYRAYRSGTTCMAWYYRLNTTTASTVSFGNRQEMPGANDADPSCYGTTGRFPNSAEPLFADYNQDGYNDVVLPNGDNGSWTTNALPTTPTQTEYHLYSASCPVPGGLTSCFSYSGVYTLDDPAFVDPHNPWLSIGDINGDGYLDVLRPKVRSNTGLHWVSFAGSGDVPSMQSSTFQGYQVLDLDGDGIAEIARDNGTNAFGNPLATVVSPTINGQFTTLPPINAGTPPKWVRWLLDLNGDGLLDIAYVNASSPNVVYGAVNAGGSAGIEPPVATTLASGYQVGQSWLDGFESGVRVMDYDLDGRQDLVLVDHGPAPGTNSTRTTLRVLLSNGYGGFNVLDSGITLGMTADGTPGATPLTTPKTPNSHGYRTSLPLNVDGDGLGDLMQVENGYVLVYRHTGKKPDMVTRISEGTGRTFDVAYAPVSDPGVYTNDPAACYPNRHLACLTSGRWLTKQVSVSGLQRPGYGTTSTTRYTYRGGVTDRFGRGFLGFESRDIYGPNSRHTTLTYDPTKSSSAGDQYAYLWAFKPLSVTTETDTSQGANPHHRQVATYTYSNDVWVNNGHFSVLLLAQSSAEYDCASNGSGGCSGTPRLLGRQDDAFQYDQLLSYNALGKVQSHTKTYRDSTSAAIQTDLITTNYGAFDVTNWLMPVTGERVTSTTPQESVTRTVKYVPNPTPNALTGLLTGDPLTIEYEPTGATSVHRLITLGRDGRGRVSTITDQDYAGSPARVTSLYFEDADGVYVSRMVDGLGHSSRVWRHPGFGFVVERDDPNGLAATTSYDTFGRKLAETEQSGALTTYTYGDGSDPIGNGGVDETILPEGRSTRQLKVHRDSFGRETQRIAPIDASRAIRMQTTFDAFGRVTERDTYTGTTTAQTTQSNGDSLFYDDLDRLTSDCHTAADNTYRCTTKQYDGLAITTTDESGRAVTDIADSMGRPSIQRVLLSDTSDATFAYGAFGLLEHQKISDGSGQTDFGYDVLGRQTSLTRKGAGVRQTGYNAFGDVVTANKLNPDGTPTQVVSYGRDALGRLSTMSSNLTAVARRYFWDKNSSGQAVTNGIGKLIDVLDDSSLVSLHFDYDQNGIEWKKTWTTYNAHVFDTYSMQFDHDSQGRLQTLTYPTAPGWTSPLVLNYAYDAYNGTTASLTDAANPGTPVWTASARNALGEITSEALKVGAGPALTRTTSYYSQNGKVSTSALAGTNGQKQLSYQYQADGLPSTLTLSGVGGTWSAVFVHDNLGRLDSWQPDTAGPAWISYLYDGDGNITRRTWSDESVTYGSTSTTRTVSTLRNGSNQTDTYQVDNWGRVWATPVVGFGYNDADEVFNFYEFATGKYDSIYRDGFGKRVLSTLSSGSTVLTLDDTFELGRDATSTVERSRLRAGNVLVGDLIRTANGAARTGTFYLTDNVGTVVAEGTSAGTISARARRDPFGNVLTNAAAPNLPADPEPATADGTTRLGFGGHDRDAAWGLVDMDARFYSPRLGRFTAPDSVISNLVDRRAYNPFAYAWNSPLAISDPSGHAAVGSAVQVHAAGNPSDHYEANASYLSSDPGGVQAAGSSGDSPALMAVNGAMSGGTAVSEVAAPTGNMGRDGAEGSSGTDGQTEVVALSDAQVQSMSAFAAFTAVTVISTIPGMQMFGFYYGAAKASFAAGEGKAFESATETLDTAVELATEECPATGFAISQGISAIERAHDEAEKEEGNSEGPDGADNVCGGSESGADTEGSGEGQASEGAGNGNGYTGPGSSGTEGSSGTDSNQGSGGATGSGSGSDSGSSGPEEGPSEGPTGGGDEGFSY